MFPAEPQAPTSKPPRHVPSEAQQPEQFVLSQVVDEEQAANERTANAANERNME